MIKLDPTSNLPASSTIQVTVVGGAGMIEDLAWNVVENTTSASFDTVASAGQNGPAQNEALHHPSYGESTAAGEMARHFPSGNLEDPSPGIPEPSASVPGFGGGCSSCGGGCGGGHVPGDFAGTGLGGIFAQDRTVVSLNNGAFIHGRIDWAYPDRSLHPVMFGRTYRSNMVEAGSQNAYLGILGYRWMFNWETALHGFTGATGDPFTLRAPDGRLFDVGWDTDHWVLPAGFYGRFFLDATNSEMKLIFRNGLTFAYIPMGSGLWKLSYVRDRNGQRQTASYTGTRLDSITDATARTTSSGYNGSGRLETITTFDNLEIAFGFNASQELVSITFPATDEFPSGRTEECEYDGTGDHLLETLTNGRGEAYLTNHYYPGGLVESQDHISGTHFCLYDFDNPSGVLTTAIDRMGNVTDVLHDTGGEPKTITQHSRGVNPLDSTTQWVTGFTHTANGEILKVVLPRGNTVKFTFDSNGYMTERRRKTSDGAGSDANDIVEKWKHGENFCLLRYMPPRANDPNLSAAEKVAFTTFYFYDHEDIASRIELETYEMGASVAISGSAEKTYGRSGSGQFPALDNEVFGDNDGDGLGDRGENLWMVLGPAPKVVNPDNPSQFQANRQVIETEYSYNSHGQLLIERDPLEQGHRLEYYSGDFDLSTYPNAGFFLYSIVDSGLTGADLDLLTGDPYGAEEPNGHLALTTPAGTPRECARPAALAGATTSSRPDRASTTTTCSGASPPRRTLTTRRRTPTTGA